jgi:hypothetical protein
MQQSPDIIYLTEVTGTLKAPRALPDTELRSIPADEQAEYFAKWMAEAFAGRDAYSLMHCGVSV